MNHLGGAFEQGDPLTNMLDVWGYLLVKFELKSVIDVGCGFGHTLKWFAENGQRELLNAYVLPLSRIDPSYRAPMLAFRWASIPLGWLRRHPAIPSLRIALCLDG